MYYLSAETAVEWRELSSSLLAGRADLSEVSSQPAGLRPALYYYLAAQFLASGRMDEARECLALGAETETLRASSYLLDYLERNGGKLMAVQPSFSDPAPWIHFSSLAHLSSARGNLIEFCTASLPERRDPLRVMDIGCGGGQLCVSLLQALVDSGKAAGVGEVFLLDPSEEMLATATANVSRAFPSAKVIHIEARLEEASEDLPAGFDLALGALSLHHMPYELKEVHVGNLREAVRDIVVFELGANHDAPEMCSPELLYSVYQTFGQSLEYIFAKDAPLEVQRACADIFVMSETISLLAEPRGQRTEYHMPRARWHELLGSARGSSLSCLGERTCFSDEYCELFALHYGAN